MPHCVLEYSSNVLDQPDFGALFKELHQLLSSSGHIQLDQLKSRAIRHEQYFVGDGAPDRAFIYLQISLLSGRDNTVRVALGEQAFAFLQKCFPRSLKELRCSMTLEMREMDRETHFKISATTGAS
ncbi:MAG: 5-carboxymethyl-2-hydroxymuconate Delta-isomerase [Oligoflexia bacterium]|nr:5-carboxymethyl-2-hydroxymuconate Delta-isomerase [Oligoflexia bacterium]